MMGYKDKQEKTMEAVNEDGWLRSGDLGKIDKQGPDSIAYKTV